MRRTRLMPRAVGLALCLLGSSCKQGGMKPNLHDRIMAAHTSQYCRMPDACFNPFVQAIESGYVVTTFLGSKPQHAQVSTNDLAKYLEGLPMPAWPRGPSITVSPTDVATDFHVVEQNLIVAQQVCGSLGLVVEVRPGG